MNKMEPADAFATKVAEQIEVNDQGLIFFQSRQQDPDYDYYKCTCMCHGNEQVRHIMACCDGGWKKIPKVIK